MNGLERNDMCTPKDFHEYLMIHQVFETLGIKTHRSYEERHLGGASILEMWPSVFWDGVHGLGGARRSDEHQHYTVTEFLIKAGLNDMTEIKRSKYNHGKPLKYTFQ